MITERAQLEVGLLCPICRRGCSLLGWIAAFLTQTVNLDDGTTVKFEIWYAQPTFSQGPAQILILVQGHCRSGTLQGRFTFLDIASGH
jgi:hypothetical protein